MKFIAPVMEQIVTTTMHSPDMSGKCIVGVRVGSGMGATISIFGPSGRRLLVQIKNHVHSQNVPPTPPPPAVSN